MTNDHSPKCSVGEVQKGEFLLVRVPCCVTFYFIHGGSSFNCACRLPREENSHGFYPGGTSETQLTSVL